MLKKDFSQKFQEHGIEVNHVDRHYLDYFCYTFVDANKYCWTACHYFHDDEWYVQESNGGSWIYWPDDITYHGVYRVLNVNLIFAEQRSICTFKEIVCLMRRLGC